MKGIENRNDLEIEESAYDIDYQNFKGTFYEDKQIDIYEDEITGAHFKYNDLCSKLKYFKILLE